MTANIKTKYKINVIKYEIYSFITKVPPIETIHLGYRGPQNNVNHEIYNTAISLLVPDHSCTLQQIP